MKRCRLLNALPFALVAVGCEPVETGSTAPDLDQALVAELAVEPATAPVARLERVKDVEAALRELDQIARIYKHSGRTLTSEFTIFHRLAGPNQEPTTLLKCDGNGIASGLRDLGHDTWEATEGYTTVIVPMYPSKNSFEEVNYSFSLGGGRSLVRKAAQDVYPQISAAGAIMHSNMPTPDSVELQPGESQVLLDYSIRNATDRPREEWETIRYLLTVSAL